LASGTEKWEGQKPGAWLREEKIYQRLFFGWKVGEEKLLLSWHFKLMFLARYFKLQVRQYPVLRV
jgi:hypothetical protein